MCRRLISLPARPVMRSPECSPDEVVDRVSRHGRRQHDNGDHPQFESLGPRQGARREEKGVARQERGEHEPCLGEDDGEKHRVDPHAAMGRYVGQQPGRVEEVVQRAQIHPI